MNSERDCEILQSDIDTLSNWSHMNEMKFHPDKCKVVSIRATSKNNYRKCKELNILPMIMRFDLSDLVLFHKIVYELIPVEIPDYISKYNHSSRLWNSRLDNMSFIFNNTYHQSNSRSKLYKAFYYRVIHVWNTLEFDTRNTTDIVEFKHLVKRQLWNRILEQLT